MRELGGEKSYTWVVGTCFGIGKANQQRDATEERLRIDGCSQGTLSVP
jgi:hypothetical protein